jgi:hypothetical protein
MVLVPVLSGDACDPAHTSLDICSQANFYNFSTSQTFTSIGETNALSALGLTEFMSAREPMQIQPYGFENLGFGPVGPTTAILSQQAVANVVSRDFMHGIFGLSNQTPNLGGIPFNVRTGTSLNATLATFQSVGLLASNSFSYTAGSIGRGWTPSLVFSGYDTSRVAPGSTLEVDVSNQKDPPYLRFPLSANLSSITFSASTEKWRPEDSATVNASSGEITSIENIESVGIDSALPQIWLPMSACAVFERVFALDWDEAAQLYLINSTTHDRLLQLNESVTFSLSSSRNHNAIVNFTLPYSAFDLNVSYPLVEEQSYYFPLKRASKTDQYVLGRTFLQETHISVNYDSGYFNLSQAAHYGEQKLETIVASTTPQNTSTPNPAETTVLPPGAYAGIGVGVGLAAITMVVVLFAWKKRWWPFAIRQIATQDRYDKAELHDDEILRVEAMAKERFELLVTERTCEIGDEGTMQYSVPGLNEVHEAHGESVR